MDTFIPALLEAWRSKEFQAVLHVFVWLGSINAGFWILARVMGAFVDVFSELFWEELWEAFATVYNLVLAVLFTAILFVSATKGAPPKDLMWREMCGFVMLYVALGAAYMDGDTHELHDHAKPGYAVGLLAYLIFAAAPKVVAYPQLADAVVLLKTLSDSWIGRGLAVFMVGGIVWKLVTRGLGEMFYHLAPLLYFLGVIKHPAIRVRRRK
jgi:hypothetical protein